MDKKSSDTHFWKIFTLINFGFALFFHSVGNLVFALLSLTIYTVRKHYEEKGMDVSEVEQDSTPRERKVKENNVLYKNVMIEISEFLNKYGKEIENDIPRSLELVEKDYGRLHRLSTLIALIHDTIIRHGFPGIKAAGLIKVLDEATTSMDKIKFNHPSFIEVLDLLLRFKDISRTHDRLHYSAHEVTDVTCQHLIINYAENRFLNEQCDGITEEYKKIEKNFIEGFSEWLSENREEINEEKEHSRRIDAKNNTDESVDSQGQK